MEPISGNEAYGPFKLEVHHEIQNETSDLKVKHEIQNVETSDLEVKFKHELQNVETSDLEVKREIQNVEMSDLTLNSFVNMETSDLTQYSPVDMETSYLTQDFPVDIGSKSEIKIDHQDTKAPGFGSPIDVELNIKQENVSFDLVEPPSDKVYASSKPDIKQEIKTEELDSDDPCDLSYQNWNVVRAGEENVLVPRSPHGSLKTEYIKMEPPEDGSPIGWDDSIIKCNNQGAQGSTYKPGNRQCRNIPSPILHPGMSAFTARNKQDLPNVLENIKKDIDVLQRSKTGGERSTQQALGFLDPKRASTRRKGPCKLCKSIRFGGHSCVLIHYSIHGGWNLSECPTVGEKFLSSCQLLRHGKIHSEDFKCHVCSKRFTQPLKLMLHIKTHTSEKPECQTGEKAFGCATSEKSFESTLTKEPFECTTNEKLFESAVSEKRFECATSKKPFECATSKKPFECTTNEKPFAHTTNEKPLECTNSEKSIEGGTTKEKPFEHTAREKPSECAASKKPFQFATSRKPFEYTTNEKPFECTTREKPFECTTREKPSECTTSEKPLELTANGNPFERTTSKKPFERATNEKRFECTTSEKHFEWATSKKPFQCTSNDKTFQCATSECITDEETSVYTISRKPFDCNICGEAFTQFTLAKNLFGARLVKSHKDAGYICHKCQTYSKGSK